MIFIEVKKDVWSPLIKEWWAQVTEIPEDNKIIVLSKGTSIGLKGDTPRGGQCLPNKTSGANLEWKKAQKKERKKNTSEIINNNIPQRNPVSTIFECEPWKLPSWETSNHHWNFTKRIILTPKINNLILPKWNQVIRPIVIDIPPTELIRGQGDSFTKW